MKMQFLILSQKYVEGIAKLQGASGRFMLHSCRMVELGRYICTSLISMNNVHFFADLY
jgi:hypothetical protein